MRLRGGKELSLICGLYIGVWSLSCLDYVEFVQGFDKIWITTVTAPELGIKLPLESSVCVRENRVASTSFWGEV